MRRFWGLVNSFRVVCLTYNAGESPAHALWGLSPLYSSFHSSNLFWSWDRVRKCSLSRNSRPKLALRLSTCPFCHGDPGRVYWGVICCFFSHVWISSLRNSGPLSLLRYLGVLPVHSCVCYKAQMTCDERNLLPACNPSEIVRDIISLLQV